MFFLNRCVSIQFIAFVSLAYSLSASAVCTPINGRKNLLLNFMIPNIVIPKDAPVGTVFYDKIIEYGTGDYASCGHVDDSVNATYQGFAIQPDGTVKTNVAGVSARVRHLVAYNSAYPLPYYQKLGAGIYSFAPGAGMQLQLIKTGPITGGTLKNGFYAGFAAFNQYWIYKLNVTGGAFIAPSCTVTNKAISVPMGDVRNTAFAGPGTPAGEKAFTIPLDCGANTKVNVTLEGAADSSGIQGVIALDKTPGSTVATGVGLQLLYNNVPIKLATPIATGSTPGVGAYSIPFVARYLQTASRVTGGAANSTATFTITYN